MAAAGGRPAYSSKLASMGFMKRAAANSLNSELPSSDANIVRRDAAHPAAQGASTQQHQGQSPSSLNIDVGQNSEQQKPSKKPKYQLSDKLTSMKFMQRSQPQKRGYEEAIGQADAAKSDAEWVAPAAEATGQGCIIIQEGDPLPAGVCGRLSFGKFNPDTELLQAQAEALATGRPLPTAVGDGSNTSKDGDTAGGVSVTDDDMAAGWGKNRSVLSSLRMQRTNKRQKVR